MSATASVDGNDGVPQSQTVHSRIKVRYSVGESSPLLSSSVEENERCSKKIADW